MTQISPTLNIIGAGSVGKSLGRAFHVSKSFNVQAICNRTPESARAACDFIGQGNPVARMSDLPPADVTMIAASDDAIAAIANNLAGNGSSAKDKIFFHCSGGMTSKLLAPLSARGAKIASVHPIKSFANVEYASRGLSGTLCGAEGDDGALTTIGNAFALCGARLIPIHSDHKMLYHAGAVFACNYLAALIDAQNETHDLPLEAYVTFARDTLAHYDGRGQDRWEMAEVTRLLKDAAACYEHAGISIEQSRPAIIRLAGETLDNIERLGLEKALTGPIARGQVFFVGMQLEDLQYFSPGLAASYRQHGQYALNLAARKNAADPQDLQMIRNLLS